MTWLPVVEREMRVAARRRVTYRVRFGAALLMFALLVFNMMNTSSRGTVSSLVGRELMQPLSFMAFAFAMLIGVIATSDSISEEKREGTLGLLFLTDLKGYDVILGKLAAHSINAFYALVAILPILGMPLLMGGVTLQQFVKVVLALISAIVLSLATGIFVSTRSQNERKAMMLTFLLLLAITCVPWLIMIWLNEVAAVVSAQHVWRGLIFSPGFAVMMALIAPTPCPPYSYWYGLAFSWMASIGLLLNAAKAVPHSWTEGAPVTTRLRVVGDGSLSAKKKKARRRLLDVNPFLWLALRGEASPRRVWFFVLSIFAMWLVVERRLGSIAWDSEVVFPAIYILHVGLKLWVAAEASRRFVEYRRSNALELLLSTPLDEWRIIGGQWRALIRQFLGPMLFILLWETCMAFCVPHRNQWPWSEVERPQLLCAMFFLPADFVAVGWAGMWFGMKSRSRGRAMLGASVVVLLVPWLCTILLMTLAENLNLIGAATTGPGSMQVQAAKSVRTFIFVWSSVIVDVVVFYCARLRLVNNFRRMAGSGSAH